MSTKSEGAAVTVFTLESVLNFGKHKGKTVREVMNTSPGYIVWAHDNIDWFGLPNELYEDACILDGSLISESKLKRGVPPKEGTPLFDDDVPF